jgi:hypothetical protein
MAQQAGYVCARRHPRRVVLGAALAGAGWLAACGDRTKQETAPQAQATVGRTGAQAAVEEPPRPGGAYTWWVISNPPSLDPHRTSAVTTMTTVSGVMGRLLRFKSVRDVEQGYNRETEPDLARSVPMPSPGR